ncbi:hypothetical protein [Parahaliea mediterranea]|uniref:hypothetical protein n=1 Tax=Parahaliea mediterranea TaxID=651086 RepID=UPI000E2F331F|nr:hypothetical protein [Parahaliea mediterranea]
MPAGQAADCVAEAKPAEASADAREMAVSFDAWQQALARRLAVSPSAEHLLLAAMLESDATARGALIARATAGHADDPFLLWSAVQFCAGAGSCSDGALAQRLAAVDGSNSETWAYIASSRFAAGEHAAALDAMRYAASAAQTRDYWTETIEMIERGLAASTDLAFAERAGMALGLAAAHLPDYSGTVRMCREQSAASVEWAYTCLRYGQLVEAQGKTAMGSAIARVIQGFAYEALGEVERARALAQQREAHKQAQLDAVKDHRPAVDRVLMSNPRFFYAYLDGVRAEGEAVALQRITTEIEQHIEQYPELGCP